MALQQNAENAEQSLSYLYPCRSEVARKQAGSYYTPADVAMFFWNQFMVLNGLNNSASIIKFWSNHHFIEPASGAGALIFSLLRKCVEIGLPLENISSCQITIIDINQAALNFVREQLNKLEKKWNFSFDNIHYICNDFRECVLPISQKTPFFFGNPPFASNPKGNKWRNIFADFLELALQKSGAEGKIHFIMPVSIAFSNNYKTLRNQIRQTNKNIALSSFDNIPNSLFPSGKPENTNTNKANSQRCSIVTIFPADKIRFLSTKMHRWRKKDRLTLLTSEPYYYDITNYHFDNQFPRPENHTILYYLKNSRNHSRFETLISKHGYYILNVTTVVRNFIGFRETPSTGTHQLQFNTENDFYSAILILSSDIFYDYWRTIGDGFHLTAGNLMSFPLHPSLIKNIDNNILKGQYMWEERTEYAKTKHQLNRAITTYDFSPIALKIVAQFETLSQNNHPHQNTSTKDFLML